MHKQFHRTIKIKWLEGKRASSHHFLSFQRELTLASYREDNKGKITKSQGKFSLLSSKMRGGKTKIGAFIALCESFLQKAKCCPSVVFSVVRERGSGCRGS